MDEKLNKFEGGYSKSDKKKIKYRGQIQKHIKDKELFVAPVQSTRSGQYRSAAYRIIYPIYKSDRLTETLANCFSCSKCNHIFLHLPKNGTGPFTSHKCFKDYNAALQKAELEAAQAEKAVADAKKKAKKSHEKLKKVSLTSHDSSNESSSCDDEQNKQSNSSSSDSSIGDGHCVTVEASCQKKQSTKEYQKMFVASVPSTSNDKQDTDLDSSSFGDEYHVAAEANRQTKISTKKTQKMFAASDTPTSNNKQDKQSISSSSSDSSIVEKNCSDNRPCHARVIADTIEKFVTMAQNGQSVTAAEIYDAIPNDFSDLSW